MRRVENFGEGALLVGRRRNVYGRRRTMRYESRTKKGPGSCFKRGAQNTRYMTMCNEQLPRARRGFGECKRNKNLEPKKIRWPWARKLPTNCFGPEVQLKWMIPGGGFGFI